MIKQRPGGAFVCTADSSASQALRVQLQSAVALGMGCAGDHPCPGSWSSKPAHPFCEPLETTAAKNEECGNSRQQKKSIGNHLISWIFKSTLQWDSKERSQMNTKVPIPLAVFGSDSGGKLKLPW